MEIIFDIYVDILRVQEHKGSKLVRGSDTKIYINYDGNENSAGFRTILKTQKSKWYRVNMDAQLMEGDMGFLYCESNNPKNRLIERKYFITYNLNEFRVEFQAISNETYVGILFYNPGSYKLLVRKFRVEYNDGERFEDEVPEKELEEILDQREKIITEMNNKEVNGYLEKFIEYMIDKMSKLKYVDGIDSDIISVIPGLEDYFQGYGKDKLIEWIVNGGIDGKDGREEEEKDLVKFLDNLY